MTMFSSPKNMEYVNEGQLDRGSIKKFSFSPEQDVFILLYPENDQNRAVISMLSFNAESSSYILFITFRTPIVVSIAITASFLFFIVY